MDLKLKKVDYSELNSRQKESYNFQKVSAILADYGFSTIRLSDDWENADFIAQHMDGDLFLKIQLKGRLSFYRKYCGKDLWICFPHGKDWYLYHHDTMLKDVEPEIAQSKSWSEEGGYSWPGLPKKYESLLESYKL